MTVRGLDGFTKRLRGVADAAEFEMAEANKANALTIQRHVVPRVPVKTGETKAAFADPAAVGISRDNRLRGGWRFGLITPELRKRGWKAVFLEFGTKGYRKGETRVHGVAGSPRIGRRGKKIGTDIGRNIPARAARPFFRPGIEAARAEIMLRWQGALRRAVELRGERITPDNNGV